MHKFFDANQRLHQLSGWLLPHDQVKKPDVEVPGWHVHTQSVVVRSIGRTAKLSERIFETVYGNEMNIQFMGNCSDGHSSCRLADCTALCCAIKLHILDWPFVVTRPKHTCEVLTNMDLNKFLLKI